MPVYHKPSAIVKFFNMPFGALASAGLTPGRNVTIETKGRRSGKTYSTPVNIVQYEGQRYLAAPRGETEWVRNVRAAGGEAVLKHGKRRLVHLEEVPVSERGPILRKYLNENKATTKAHFEAPPGAPVEEFQRIAANHPVFRIHEA